MKSLLLISFLFACGPMAFSQTLHKTFDGFSINDNSFTSDQEIFSLLQNNPSATEAYENVLRYKSRSKKLGYFGLGALGAGGLLMYSGTRERDPNPGLVIGGLLFVFGGSMAGTVGVFSLVSANQEKTNVVKYYNSEIIGSTTKERINFALDLNQNGVSFVLIF